MPVHRQPWACAFAYGHMHVADVIQGSSLDRVAEYELDDEDHQFLTKLNYGSRQPLLDEDLFEEVYTCIHAHRHLCMYEYAPL